MKENLALHRTYGRRSLLRDVAACSIFPWTVPAGHAVPALAAADGPTKPEDEARWAQVRSQFLFEPQHVYFNNASLGSPPAPVLESVAHGYRRLAANPTAAKAEYFTYLESTVRPAVARLLGANLAEIVLTRGASEGLYLIANGLDLKPGDEIVTTTQEHPGGLTPWLVRAERSGIIVRQVPMPSPIADSGQPVEVLSRALTPRTRVLFFCHVTRGGLLYPVRELCALARSKGIISAVDGAQAVGTLQVDTHVLGCDLYATSLHKWTLAPAGNGALYVRSELRPRFRSLFKTTDTDRAAAGYYDILGTYGFPVRAAAATALEFIERTGGVRVVEQRNRMLSDYLKQELIKVPGLRLASSTLPEVSSPGVTMFECPGMKAVDIERILLDRYRIHVDDHVRDGHDAVRVSTHFYNNRSEVDRLIGALREVIRKM